MSTDRAATLNVRPETIADLKGHPQNYNRHSPQQLAELVRSIRRHGAYKNVVVSADGYILAGHGILEAARREGYKQWPCERRDYDHDHPDALNLLLTDNEVGNPANPLGPDPDQALLAALAQQINEATGLEGTGLDDARLAELLAATQQPPEPLEDPGPGEPPKAPVTKPGDVWIVGPHRIGCFDCRDEHAVAALFAGQKARMVWTDPPYGVDYAGGTRDPRSPKYRSGKTIENDALSEEDTGSLVHDTLTLAAAFSVPGGTCYAACPAGTPLPKFIAAFGSSGFEYHHSLSWVKSSAVFGRCDYHYRHEVVLYGWKPDAGHLWNGDHTQTSVFEVDRPYKSDLHPTMKPVELIAPMVTNSSRQGEIVFDPFVGSGSTAIACAQTGRVCYCCDVEPRYVDVTVARLATALKQPALLSSTGERFPMPEEA